MDSIQLKAMAKINLGLDVIRKREDGYHEVRMIMQTVNVYDRIELRKRSDSQIRLTTNLHYLPVNENNLAYKAAKQILDEFPFLGGVDIQLQKHIPVAAGMAGGSSDAASVLHGMNQMFALNLSLEELMARGVRIGADVPYCLMGGTALAEGIGEKLTPLVSAPSCYVLLAKPPYNISTKFVYENLHADQLKPCQHPDIDGQIEAILRNDLYGMAQRMGNVLETVTIPACPVIARIQTMMRESGALNAMMSGSGPTVFGLYDDEKKAKDAYWNLKGKNVADQVILTKMTDAAYEMDVL